MTTATKITSLNELTSLNDTISADTEVCVPGYYLESTDIPSLWLLTDSVTDIPEREIHVVG